MAWLPVLDCRFSHHEVDKGYLMNLYTKWAQREHSAGTRIAATLMAGVIFVILLPRMW